MNLAIYGTGGSGREVYELLERNDSVRKCWEEIIFVDDTKEAGEFWDCPMMPLEDVKKKYKSDEIKIIVAVGEPKVRKLLADKVKEAGYGLATIIHPTAAISPRAKIADGVFIQDYVAVSAEAVIDENVFINGRSIIGHDVHVKPNCQISSHVAIGGWTIIGEGVYIGLSASLRDHIEVGDHAVVSMGSVVLKDVHEDRVVMGNPAREIASSAEGRVFK